MKQYSMASGEKATSARRAVRRASRIAVPVMGIGFIGIWGEATHAARTDGHGSMILGTTIAVLMSLLFLSFWLGCAAVVGWMRGNPEAGSVESRAKDHPSYNDSTVK